MKKISFLLASLAVVVATQVLFACESILCAGTRQVSNFSAVYTGCGKNSGGQYTTANLTVECTQTLASGSGTLRR